MKTIYLLVALVCAGGAIAATTSTVTPGTWDGYLGSTIKTRAAPTEAACIKALEALKVSGKYTCRTRTSVVVAVTVDPPPPAPVDCAVSMPVVTSTAWSPALCPSSAKQTRTTTSTRSVVTAPANGGAACPALVVTTTEEQPCTYVPPVDPVPPIGGIVYASPPTADMSALKAGETLVLRAGTYTSLKLKACQADAWCTVRAENDGAVTLTGLSIGRGNWYLRLEGLKFAGSSAKSITGSFVKVFRTYFSGGPKDGNDVSVQIGTNDFTPGASNILLEDVWVSGLGGRYKVLVYNSQNVVLRRVVTRHDGGWGGTDGNPQGGFALYDSQNVTCQDCLFVDSVQNLAGFEAAIYLVSNGTALREQNVSVNGAIIIGSPNNGLAAEGHGAATSYTITDVAVVGSVQGGFNTNNEAHVLNVTRGLAVVKGAPFAAWAGAVKASACVYKGGSNSGASLASCSSTLPANPTVLNSAGQGANIQKRIGISGTLFGEPGYDQVTNEDLWPYPNEARIKADFDTVRPAFGGKSLTDYVREAKL